MSGWLSLLLAVFCAIGLASLGLGDHPLPLREVWLALIPGQGATPEAEMVVLDLRLPRLLAAGLGGAALAVSGALVQAVLRNPLADPGLLGINSGAALVVIALMVLAGPGVLALLPVAGFAGALLSVVLVWALAWQGGASPLRLVLVGLALAAMTGAMASVLTTFAPINAAQRALIWLAGSLHDIDRPRLQLMALWLALPLGLSLALARHADALNLGETTARALGQRVEVTRAALILIAALLAGATVAITGPIGFVGLIAPHLARHIAGPLHARMLPVAALIGACLVAAADLAGRLVFAPVQIPAGLVTALIGGPFFFWLIWSRRHARS
ncbi:iron ABC transporter permease [Xinfangfangia sp. D13-10-4-6]|uniref:FecCD family ABC transporter permease n=1 Tax=Pseudogemmobacter hezensis TaxID=2737662 RepID=UPI0015541F26|nr:iron ABC transporter permease [Pseudogemmobacter hezensis]NPD17423.1 iron ABC transporter permease [Pseudogemmobacter hezensis]